MPTELIKYFLKWQQRKKVGFQIDGHTADKTYQLFFFLQKIYFSFIVTLNSKMTEQNADIKLIKEKIIPCQDFPKPGVLFRDIFGVLGDPEASKVLHRLIKDVVVEKCPDFDLIVGLDARGFLFGSPLALSLDKPFVPIRKKGKLPPPVKSISYDLEYGQDTFEIQLNSIKSGQKVVIIDDLIANGGTMKAAIDLVESVGGIVTLSLVCIELEALKGREKLNVPFKSIVQY